MSEKYPELISEKNFHWTYEQWEKELSSLNLVFYDMACASIQERGFPKMTTSFEYFTAADLEETYLKYLIRVCSCLYAYEQNEISHKEAWILINKLERYTRAALIDIVYFQYSIADLAIVSLRDDYFN